MKKITAILLGAGARGNIYAHYARECPEEFQIVGVAEPDRARREQFVEEYGIAPEHACESWEQLLGQPKFADACLVCTLDDMHTKPAVQALTMGYHVLLEKPMASTEAECRQIEQAASGSGLVLSVCHVLRYTPFYSKIKQLLDEGVLGQMLCIQQIENVGYWHQAHSFVRGNWNNSETTSPMLLQKSCHDMDIISWLMDSRCSRVSSFGSLTHFKPENAPRKAPARCLDGCPAAGICPYYAPRFYLEHPRAEKDGFVSAITTDTTRKGILEALESGPYGRCVYHCDNNVVDHQVVNLEFENTGTASFVMTAFTQDCNRTLKIMGTRGELIGDMEKNEIVYQVFGAPDPVHITVEMPKVKNSYNHGGGDFFLIRDFVRAVQADETAQNKTTAAQSLQAHLMCFAAEKARNQHMVVDL